jgi:hypothetical protein
VNASESVSFANPPPKDVVSHPTTLVTLLSQPPQKSFACPLLLAVISWVSPSLIHRANTPFPPKRHIKIHDPSIIDRYSGITVAVFVDAEKFKPSVGTVGLFRGLTMNWVQGGQDVILNRYPFKDGEGVDGAREWFIGDEGRLAEMGYDVEGWKASWNERSRARKK